MRPDKVVRKKMLVINLLVKIAKAMKDYQYYKDLPETIYYNEKIFKRSEVYNDGGIYYFESEAFNSNNGEFHYRMKNKDNFLSYIDESSLLKYITYYKTVKR